MSDSNDKSNKPKGLTGNLNSNKNYKPIPMPGMGIMNPNPNGVPGMPPGMPKKQKTPEEMKEELDKLKGKLEGLKKNIVKKYKFTRFLSILPQAGLPFFAEDENMPVEIEKTNPTLMMMCIPEDNFKDINKIREDVVSMIKETKENVWLIVKTEVDIWHYGMDSKFDLLDLAAQSFPIHDNGFLGVLRLASIHKTLVLRKFEKYVATYAIGGSLVRGVADKDSDVDTIVIIDDTDVKRMPRLELLEKLRGMIYDYIREATALAGVKNPLNVQVWLLTDFWQRVKDAEPVAFTFIRDGIPMYDRGTFIPWKLLLKMGKIKPSPEAVDMFMKSGEQTDSLVKRRLMDCMVDIYFGIVTPTQALMMLTGNAPPEPKGMVAEVEKILVKKEKLMSVKDLKTLEKAIKLYKDYEHGKLKEISGTEIDKLKKESEEYVKSMKLLRDKIETRMQEHESERIERETVELLKTILGNKGKDALIKDFDKNLVKTGKVQRRMSSVIKDVLNAKAKVKGKKKLTTQEMHKLSAEASELIDALTEYSQRKELVALQKSVVQIKYGKDKEKKAELMVSNDDVFVISDGQIRKIVKGKLIKSDEKSLNDASKKAKDSLKVNLNSEVMKVLQKEFGEFSFSV